MVEDFLKKWSIGLKFSDSVSQETKQVEQNPLEGDRLSGETAQVEQFALIRQQVVWEKYSSGISSPAQLDWEK